MPETEYRLMARDGKLFMRDGKLLAKRVLLNPSDPALLLQAALIDVASKSKEGSLVVACGLPWLEIIRELERNPDFLHHFARHPRQFEEFIAGAYKRSGFDEVILTPKSGDGGRDVIAVKHGFGSIRVLEQTKAYSPGHLVTHNDLRAMLGVLQTDPNSSKGIVTTTSDFEPGILKGPEFMPFMPYRLETKNGRQLVQWLREIEGNAGIN